MTGKIFINYRRGDDPGFTQALYQRLEEEFPRGDLFMDVEGHIRPGDDFVAVLEKQVAACDVLLAVMGPRWERLLAGRAGDPEDFVTIEIAAALDQGKWVIPVLVGGAAMPRADALPAEIRALARRNAIILRPERFRADCQGLVTALEEYLGAAERERAPGRGRRPAGRSPTRWAALGLLGVLAIATVWYGVGQLTRVGVPDRAASSAVKDAQPAKALREAPAPDIDVCAKTVTFACLRAGLVRGHLASDLRQAECAEERTYLPVELGWKSIWTTSVYSYASGGGGPGGGLENEELRIGGWGDLYYALMQFETPKLLKPARFAAVLLFAKTDDGTPVAMHLDRITRNWGWKPGDRLWWKDRPSAVFVASITQPAIDKWYAIEVTDMLEDWRLGRSVNHGLQLRPADNNRNFNAFHSNRSPDLEKQPRLLVCT